jgi:hypothetical protein
MTSVRKATKEDFDHIFPLFQGFATHTQVNPQDWKKIFSPLWSGQREQFGYILEDGNEAVGFLGTLYSLRMIQGEKREFCNLTSWIVRPDYRSESLSLLFPLMGDKDLTLTNFTASNRVIEVLLRLGFQSLEDHYRMILPLPVARGNIKITSDPEQIRPRLSGLEASIFQDHLPLHCRHVLLESSAGHCYLVLNPAIKRNLPVMFVNYFSDPGYFLRNIQQIALHLCRQLHIYGLMVGEHSLGRKSLPLALRIKRRHALLFKSRVVSPEDVDTLYSEIQVLGLKPV